MQERIFDYGNSFTPDEQRQATETLTEWFDFDTWTVNEGLRLLAGIDPHRSPDLLFGEDGFTFEENPTWARITQKPGLAMNEPFDDAGFPKVIGYCIGTFQIEVMSRLLNIWVTHPDHTLNDRHPPSYFVQWAANKRLQPFWMPWAVEAGLLPQARDDAPADPEPQAAKVQDVQTDANPWYIKNQQDPNPKHPWFTPARYFARELVKEDSTLLLKREVLAEKTAKSLFAAGIYKRGNILRFAAGTVLKALNGVKLG